MVNRESAWFVMLNTGMNTTLKSRDLASIHMVRIEIKFGIREILVCIPAYRSDSIECPAKNFDNAVERYLLTERLELPEYVYTNTLVRNDEFNLSDLTYHLDVEFIDKHSKNKFKLTNPSLKFL